MHLQGAGSQWPYAVMGQRHGPRLRFAATLAAVFSVVLHAMLSVYAAGMKPASPSAHSGDADALAWLVQTGALICHGAPSDEDETPGHPIKKQIGPCLICASMQAACAPVQEANAPACVRVEVAIGYWHGSEQTARDAELIVFQPRGPPARLA